MPPVIEIVPRGEGLNGENYNILGYYHGPYDSHGQKEFWVSLGGPFGLCLVTDEVTVDMNRDFVRVRTEGLSKRGVFWRWAWVLLEAPEDLWELDWWRRV